MNDPGEPSLAEAAVWHRPRVRYFDRPKPPHDWRWWIGGIGRTLIVLGLLMFAFVGYQLWGTGLQTARAQDDLEAQFRQALEGTTTIATTSSTPSTPTTDQSGTTTTSTVPVAPNTTIANGDWIGRLVIPKISLDWIVVEGVGADDLRKGPGHFRETPMPGQLGNAAIAGHRTTYGHPFLELDQLVEGDLIQVQTLAGSYTYRVTGSEIVSPNDYAKVIPTTDPTMATLTLATCHPAYTARERLIVHAALVPEQSDQVYAPPSNTTPPTTPETIPGESLPGESLPGDSLPGDSVPTGSTVTPTPPPPSTQPADTFDDTFVQGWFDDSAAIPHVLLWGALLVAVVVGSWYAGKRARLLPVCFAVGAVPFVVVLYFFFENVNRLLPPGL